MLKEILSTPAVSIDAYARTIRGIVPPSIMAEAEQIVKAHRPTDLPEGFEVYNMAGLKPKDHGFLNGIHCRFSKEEQRGILAKKRAEYAGDPVALQQIDVYDGDTEYHVKLREFIGALKSGDIKREQELQRWFDEHYPNIK